MPKLLARAIRGIANAVIRVANPPVETVRVRPRLHIEMVPGPLWGMNLRSKDRLGNRWRKLRKSILAERGPACAICGNEANPHGHEIWTYEEKRRTGIARLIGIEIICGDCHSIHHWGVTQRLEIEGILEPRDLNRLIRHACKVNGYKRKDFNRDAKEADAVWRRQSELKWKIDWGQYKEAVSDAKAARVEWAIRMEKAA